MKPAVEISPGKDGEGFCLVFQGCSHWFAQEHHAIGYAQDVYPDFDIVLLGPDGGIRRRYTPGKSERGERSDSSIVTPPPRVLPAPEDES
jgi:hypothetical protein